MHVPRSATAALAIAAALLLSACTAPTEAPLSSPTSAVPDATASAPAPADPAETPDAATSPEPLPEGGGGDAAPAGWDDDEVLGVCKEELVRTSAQTDLAQYVPGEITRTSSGYSVKFSDEGGDTVTCQVAGTPEESQVTVAG